MKKLFCLLLCLCLIGCARGQKPQRYTASFFDLFDTVTIVVGYAASQQEWDAQMDALYQDLKEYHQLFDIYHPYADLVNLHTVNATAAQQPVVVDARIFDLLLQAKQLHSITNGKTNIAMGRLFALWHSSRTAAQQGTTVQLPSAEALQQAAAQGDMQNLVLNPADSSVFFADPALRLDVGSIGKGYAVEQAAQAAEKRGLTSALISVGGNLRSIGTKPDGSVWSGGVQNPSPQAFGQQEYLCAVGIQNAALVTSGDYQRFFTLDGVRYHHLIDTETQQPARYFHSVSVLAADSGLADGLSTGLFCMDLAAGQALVESLQGVEAMWALPSGEIVYSQGFSAALLG